MSKLLTSPCTSEIAAGEMESMAGSLLHADEGSVAETPDEEYDEYGVRWIAPGLADMLDDEPMLDSDSDSDNEAIDLDILPAELPGEVSPMLGKADENGFAALKDGVTSDTGAADHVGPPGAFPDYPMRESPGSKRGVHYVAAGGARLPNLGQKTVLIMTANKKFSWMTVQMAKMKKVLGSVSKNNANGVDAIYKADAAYLQNQRSGVKTPLRRQRGVFVMDTWVVPYAMAKTRNISYRDENGVSKTVKINMPTEGFSRPE